MMKNLRSSPPQPVVDSYLTKRGDDNDSDSLHVGQQPKHTTPSQDKMLEQMAYLQMNQGMPHVSWSDFKELGLARGTIRNNLYTLKNMGLIEYSHRSSNAYYTLPKDSLQNTMTLNHLWDTKPKLASLIERLVFDTPAAHNIRLFFPCSADIYNTVIELKAMEEITPINISLVLPREILENGAIEAGITVHHNNTVSISLACSEHPIHFDIAGLVKLTSSISQLEERLRCKLLNRVDIPYYGTWTVVMWHIGIDSKERYTGPAYEETWENIRGEMYRIYSKLIEDEKKRVLRLERQETPNNPVHDAVEQMLCRVLGGDGGGGSSQQQQQQKE